MGGEPDQMMDLDRRGQHGRDGGNDGGQQRCDGEPPWSWRVDELGDTSRHGATANGQNPHGRRGQGDPCDGTCDNPPVTHRYGRTLVGRPLRGEAQLTAERQEWRYSCGGEPGDAQISRVVEHQMSALVGDDRCALIVVEKIQEPLGDDDGAWLPRRRECHLLGRRQDVDTTQALIALHRAAPPDVEPHGPYETNKQHHAGGTGHGPGGAMPGDQHQTAPCQSLEEVRVPDDPAGDHQRKGGEHCGRSEDGEQCEQ